MNFSVKGKLHKIFETETKSASFKSREFILLTDEKYPQYIKFQLVQDNVSKIDSITEGSEIEVHFDLRGKENQGKFFTNLQAWKVVSN